MLKFIQVKTEIEIELARRLFLEYARSLNFNLCFQDFNKELASLPGEYSPPEGRLLLAYYEESLCGCVALRKINDGSCEMKRLYLQSSFRGLGIGRKLAEEIINEARNIGYVRMRLDTVPTMKEAIALYHDLGFKEIGPYRVNPVEGALYMELNLARE